jgi:hypothetical protein
MVNKKGIVRIIEAAIASFILIGFVALVLANQVQKPDLSDNIYRIEHQILREIADNYTLRDNVLQNKDAEVKSFVKSRLAPFPLNFSVSINSPERSSPCNCPSDKDIYADEIIVSTNLSNYGPKKVSLFVWVQ